MQSVPITIWFRVRCTTLYDKVLSVTGWWFSPVSSTKKTDTNKQTTNIFFICRMIKTFGGDTIVELVDDDKTISCHIQDKLDRDEDVNIACCSPSKFEYK